MCVGYLMRECDNTTTTRFLPRLSQPNGRREFRGTSIQRHQHHDKEEDAKKEQVRLTFVDSEGNETDVHAVCGDNILTVAHKNDINLEGACECSIACSTCHVILEDEMFDELPEPCEAEEDMLDLAFGLTPTSRLGCQVIVDTSHDGTKIELPSATRNFYVDGHVPQPH